MATGRDERNGLPESPTECICNSVPPLLKFINVVNFSIDDCFHTSCGKSTLLRIAASSVGRPCLSVDGQMGVVYGWDATQVWRERVLVAANDLPSFFDDTKLARFPDEVPKMAYVA